MKANGKVGFFSISLVRGLLAMPVGILVGMGLVSIIRLLLGLQAWKAEPAWVLGAVFGTFAFVLATGVTGDWLKMGQGKRNTRAP